ncbi:cardiolipin synthase [Paraclostridium sordellii]|uniref:cardiolipin synthase n=1 Tax=Paraclostridium sordellii TaxID=1505 RepID=UPI002E8E5AEA|nr:cardiolipin synthase [Paeniclostridium sordellii]
MYIINFLVMLNLIFRERRSIDSTVAWILILTIVPAVGFVLYIVFGRRMNKYSMFKLKKDEDKRLKNRMGESCDFLQYSEKFEPNVANHRDMIYTLANLNSSPYTTNNKVSIYTDGNEFFNELKEQLRKAKKYINIEFYIFKDDGLGNEILDILIEKLSEGVEVRLLYDTVGSRLLSKNGINRLKEAGGKTGAFFPSFLKIINFNLNYRNHRKIVVVDGEVGFVGGFNVGDEYLGKDPKFGYWRDTHTKIIGAAVNDLNLRFMLDWRYTTHEDIDFTKYLNDDIHPYNGNLGMQIVSSGPDLSEIDEIKYGYLKMIQKAKKYIYIQSPYLILDSSLLDALKIASLSGVDVRIMIPSKPDHPFVYWATYSYAGELLKFGAKIYTYGKDAFLHSKTVVMDDSICSIGTANMDIRSFELNFEVNAFMYCSEVAIKQKHIFEEDIKNCTQITQEIYDNRSQLIRFKESISRLLSPVL